MFVAFQSATMACFALTTSNFGAMAMEPVASVAGIGASLQGFTSTLGGALVGGLIGWQFNGTTVPLAAGSLCCGLASLLFVLLAEKGRLFRGHHTAGEAQAAAGAQGRGGVALGPIGDRALCSRTAKKRVEFLSGRRVGEAVELALFDDELGGAHEAAPGGAGQRAADAHAAHAERGDLLHA